MPSGASPVLEELLAMVRCIARAKDALPFRYRRSLNCYGVYVQRRPLPGGASFYVAGERFTPRLEFIQEAGGRVQVGYYEPGEWEGCLRRTFAKAERVLAALERHDQEALQRLLWEE